MVVAHTVLATTDLDEARDAAASAYYPHRLSGLGRTRGLDMRIHTGTVGPVTVGHLRYGADVRLDCGELHSGYQVNVPITGRVASECGPHTVVSTPGRATVYLPVGRTSITSWSADCTVYGVKIERQHLERELQRLLDRPVRGPLRLAPSLDVGRGVGAGWLRLVRTLVTELTEPDGLLDHELVAQQLTTAVTTGLLLAACREYRDELLAPHPPARPRLVKRAIDAIEARPEAPWTVAELAAVAGSSVRRLHEGFRRYVGVSPMAYLRDVRLTRVHEELTAAAPGATTVAEVAYRWGFGHPGRLAAEYGRRFGTTPSATLHS